MIGCIVLSVKLDENAFGYIEEGEFVESADQDQDYFAEQGKLLSELAPKFICIYFDQMIYFKALVYENLFQK